MTWSQPTAIQLCIYTVRLLDLLKVASIHHFDSSVLIQCVFGGAAISKLKPKIFRSFEFVPHSHVRGPVYIFEFGDHIKFVIILWNLNLFVLFEKKIWETHQI